MSKEQSNSDEIQRYDPALDEKYFGSDCFAFMNEDDNGDYVLYEDYGLLQEEIEELKSFNENYLRIAEDRNSRIKELEEKIKAMEYKEEYH